MNSEKKLLIGGIIMGFLLSGLIGIQIIHPSNAIYGLSCEQVNMTRYFEVSDVIFSGKAISKTYLESLKPNNLTAVTIFSINEPFKGVYQDQIKVSSNEKFWGINFTEGLEYIVFASKVGQEITPLSCSPTYLVEDSDMKLIREIASSYDLLPLKHPKSGAEREILILLENKIRKVYYTGENIISVLADPETASVIFETGANAKLNVKAPQVYKVGPGLFTLRNGEEFATVTNTDKCFYYATIETQGPEKIEIIFAAWPEYKELVENCETFIVSPLKQIKLGIEPFNVVCGDGLNLLLKPTKFTSPACVTDSTYQELSSRGWSLVGTWNDEK